MGRRPVGIDLFAGAGGLSLGFEQAGFDVAVAVEIDPVHAATHKYNFPKCGVLPRSVVGLSGAGLREQAKLGKKKIDVVFGGAPCQGFSLIGQRTLDDPRNLLVAEFARLVTDLDADYFVFENVKGLTLGRHRRFLEELIQEFECRGYNVQTPWKVLNAVAFGVPQDRERLFLLGAKRGLGLPSYPLETRSHPEKSSSSLLPAGPTCGDALDDLPEAEIFSELASSDSVATFAWSKPSKYAAELRCLKPKDWRFGYKRIWDPNVLTSSMCTSHTDISRRRFSETTPGQTEPISRFYKLSSDGVSNTLRAGTDGARGAFTSPRPIHYSRNRCVTVREMARLHGFPDWFRFHETKWHGARQIGNSVPPPLARAVAASIIEAIGLKPSCPRDPIFLGEQALLRMDVSEASNFWNVDPPLRRRDRKSGQKKRKQSEIEALKTECHAQEWTYA